MIKIMSMTTTVVTMMTWQVKKSMKMVEEASNCKSCIKVMKCCCTPI